MSSETPRGIRRQGVDAAFEAEETRKSNLILEARLLRDQHQPDEAAARFAQAAQIEEQLGARCASQGLVAKALVHRFSAASCWAQAGNFYDAIALCADLLADGQLPERLRQQVEAFAAALRLRRSQWYEGMTMEAAAKEV
jgi:hypothetical protein